MAVNASLARLRTAGSDLGSHALTIKTLAIARSKQTYLRRGVASLSKRGWTKARFRSTLLTPPPRLPPLLRMSAWHACSWSCQMCEFMKSFKTACLLENKRECCSSKRSAVCSGLAVLVRMRCAGSRTMRTMFGILPLRRRIAVLRSAPSTHTILTLRSNDSKRSSSSWPPRVQNLSNNLTTPEAVLRA